MPNRIPVGVLGATGAVGQKFVALLENHPWFELTELAASDRSAGKSYKDATVWRQYQPIPERLRDRTVKPCEPALDCRVVFSGLDSSVAGEIEENFARAGYIVVSNSRNHRMDDDVPLLVPDFARRMIDLLTDHDIAVMEIDGFPHPLSAVYRRSTLPHVEALLAQDRLRPAFLFDAVRTRRVQPAEMISVDPELLTLRNLNTREDYLEALSIAGLSPGPM